MKTMQMYNALIVDDEMIEREGLKKLMETFHLPFYVHLASDGEVALDYLQKHPDTDLLITDIQMSFRDGLSLIDMAHQLYPVLPVVIFSAYDKFDYARKAISLNVTEYLLKPIEPDIFLHTMQKIIAICEKNALNRAPSVIHVNSSEPKNTTVQLIRSIIESEYNKDISLEYIAEKCHRSTSYISSLFHAQTGCSVIQYIKEFRIRKAMELLKNTNLKISDISAIVGYENPNYFNKVFQSVCHVSPGDYRKEIL